MTGFITFLLLIAWGFLVFYCPRILYGYTYTQIISVMDSEDAQLITEFAKALGLTDENAIQVASKYFYTCIGIIIGTLILILIIRKALSLLEQYINRKNELANALNMQKIKELKKNNRKFQEKRTPDENIEIINELTNLDEEKNGSDSSNIE